MGFRDRAAAGAAASLAAMVLGGCGSSTARTATATIPRRIAHLHQTAPPRIGRHAKPAGPPLGVTQHTDIDGASLVVTITRLIDPLRDSGASLLPGTRAVGVMVEIANNGPQVYDSSATGDFSVVAKSGVVTPVFAPQGICQTPLRDFDNYITPGERRAGCVVFAISSRTRVLAVRFSPHAGAAGRLTWGVS